jgi:hypothetical protein
MSLIFLFALFISLSSGQIPIPPRPDGFSLGVPSASIVLDAHLDLLCPYCALVHTVLSALSQHYTQVYLSSPPSHNRLLQYPTSLTESAAGCVPFFPAAVSPQRVPLLSGASPTVMNALNLAFTCHFRELKSCSPS